ncbi:reverse transcriptase domain-containing protein [Tanacetum coccineum]
MTPPPGFSTLTPIPSPNTNKLPPITTFVFTANTPENTPLTHHASTSANPNPMISPAFVEDNYEVLESLLRERRKQIRNVGVRTELEYFSEEYDEEREIESRPERERETTPVLRMRSPRARRQRERVVEFKEAPNIEGGRVERNTEGGIPSEPRVNGSGSRGTNLPPLLAAHPGRSENVQPLQSSLTSVYEGHQPSTNIGGNPPLMDYPLPDGLKMPYHVGSYDGKGDPDNYLHLFEWAIRMQKWAMPVACHMFTYTLKDSARIWWNSQKAGNILNYEDLKAKFRSHFSQQKKFMKTHLVVHNIKHNEGESTRAFVTRYTDDTLQILGLHEDQRISGFVHGLRTRNLVEFLSTDLPTTYKGLMEKTYTWIEAREVATNGGRVSTGLRKTLLGTAIGNRKTGTAKTFEQPPCMLGHRRSRDTTKYCQFHKDHGHDINDCRELRHQIEEGVKSRQLSHLVKGIKKGKAKVLDTQRGDGKKEKDTAPVEAPILMISRREPAARRVSAEEPMSEYWGITSPPVVGSNNSSAPVIIKAKISGR